MRSRIFNRGTLNWVSKTSWLVGNEALRCAELSKKFCWSPGCRFMNKLFKLLSLDWLLAKLCSWLNKNRLLCWVPLLLVFNSVWIFPAWCCWWYEGFDIIPIDKLLILLLFVFCLASTGVKEIFCGLLWVLVSRAEIKSW